MQDTPTTPTKRLSWRTKRPQYFQSFGCGQMHEIAPAGTCEVCGRSVYSVACMGEGTRNCGDRHADDPDPRGAIPHTHTIDRKHAHEYGCFGRDLVACAACADDGDRYRALLSAAKSTGTWKEIKTTPEYWTRDGIQTALGQFYESPEGTLWHVGSIEGSSANLWTINAWGQVHRQAVQLYDFVREWKEYGGTR